MPELPEVEFAVRIVRRAVTGRTITSATVLHPSQRRALPDEAARSLVGDRIGAVDRRGKHQLLRLTSGRTLHVHFRMTGDWRAIPAPSAQTLVQPVTGHPRFELSFDDGSRLVLDDPRALSAVVLYDAGVDPLPSLGPEATDPAFNATTLAHAVGKRRIPIKVALLDQAVVAGIGNIYASEALWRARLDPRVEAGRLTQAQRQRLVVGVRQTMDKALRDPGRYYGAAADDPRRFNVYDREGLACRRCRAKIRRLTQAGRSTYFCPSCQKKR
ncbi:MAG: bifunctional DNA-formamidopyrimidine glycosylase/DNA-(apurinic or apyrimidinic site) lyase [Gemmatimonadaceae bacterium]